MTFEQFSQRCKKVGLTPSGLATASGVSRATISNWKLGNSSPNPATIFKLERALQEKEETIGYIRDDTGVPAPALTGDILTRVVGNTTTPAENKKTIVYAPDNSMVFDCIPKGAEITVIPATDYDGGEIVAVIMQGNTLIRRFHRQDGNIILSSSNPKYSPIITTTETLKETGDGIIGICDKVTFHLK